MSTSSCSGCQVVTVWLLSTLVFVVVVVCGATGGYEATPLWVARVPLHMGGSIPHQGGRCLLVPLPNMEGYLPITPPCLVLLTMMQFHEWSHQSQGPLSNGSDIIPSAR